MSTKKAIVKTVEMVIAMVKVFVAANVRLPQNLKIRELMNDIRINGLMKRIVVAARGDKYEVVEGHRRLAAIQLFVLEHPKEAGAMFSKGIPVTVWTGLTDAEILRRKVDHGNELSLSSPHEAYLCVKLLLDAETAEADIAVTLAGLFDRTNPPKAKAKSNLETFREAIANAKTDSERSKAEKDYRKEILDYRKGLIQGYKDIYTCPDVVEAASFYKHSGEKPQGFEDVELPQGITSKQVKSLRKAFIEDMETAGNKHSKLQPGPLFWKAWEKVLKDDREKQNGNKEPRSKAMSAKEMEEELSKSKWQSQLAQELTRRHAGQTIKVEDIVALDRKAFYLDVVLEHGNAELVNELQKEAEDIIRRINAEAQEKAKADTPETANAA